MVHDRIQDRLLLHLGRRVLTLTLTAVGALLAAVVIWPKVSVHYYARRIDSPDPAVRARALEAVLPRAAASDPLRRRLLDVLAQLASARDEISPLQARIAAGWLFRHVPAFAELAEADLTRADDESFARLARLLHAAGHWDRPSRPIDQWVRWLTHQYRTLQGSDRAETVRSMARLGPAAGAGLRGTLEEAISDPAAEVRRAAIEAVPVLVEREGLNLLVRSAEDPEPPNRRQVILMMAAAGATAEVRAAIARRLQDEDASVRQAAAWVGSRYPELAEPRGLAAMLEGDPAPPVRAMAALAVRDNACLVRHLTGQRDAAVRARCLWALRPPLSEGQWAALLECVRSEGRYWVVMAAVTAVGRCAPRSGADAARDALLARLEQALGRLEDDLAAACLRALGEVPDASISNLMEDVVSKLADRPWVSCEAARAMARIDPTKAGPLLVGLLETPHPAVRDTIAFELARASDPDRTMPALRTALRSPNEFLRAGAVLARALIARRTGRSDADLGTYLRERTDPNGPWYEQRPFLRGYYLAARLLMGEQTVADRVRELTYHDEVSITAVSLALLAAGDPWGMDGILHDPTRMPPGFEPRVFLCDQRFGEIVQHYLPDAPEVDWRFDPDLQSWQVDRLREWWSVRRGERRSLDRAGVAPQIEAP